MITIIEDDSLIEGYVKLEIEPNLSMVPPVMKMIFNKKIWP